MRCARWQPNDHAKPPIAPASRLRAARGGPFLDQLQRGRCAAKLVMSKPVSPVLEAGRDVVPVYGAAFKAVLMVDRDRSVLTTPAQLEAALREQIGFLAADCAAFDAGNRAYGKRISNTLRLLFKHRGQTKALLEQLGLREIAWLDTTLQRSLNEWGDCGLLEESVEVGFIEEDGQQVLGPPKTKVYPAFLEPQQLVETAFEAWWTNPVAIGVSGVTFGRRDLVSHVSETDGGAHVDSAVDRAYAQLRTGEFLRSRGWGDGSSIGLSLSPAPGGIPFEDGHLVVMRTIAHEVLLTLYRLAIAGDAHPYRWRDRLGTWHEFAAPDMLERGG